MRRKLCLILLVSIVFSLAGSAWAGARPDKSWKNWFGHFYGGYDFTTGDWSNLVDDGWTLGGGATWWPESAPVGLRLDLGYNNSDISSAALQAINEVTTGNITTGDVDIWSLTTNVVWGPDNSGPVSFYLTGGVGAYYLKGQIGSPGVFTGIICDPWYPFWCYPGTVPGTVIQGSESTTEWGYNAGVGLTIEVGQSGSQIYFEAIYHSAQTDQVTADYVPLVFGYRW